MSEHFAHIEWRRKADDVFYDNKFSRRHTWHFDGGIIVDASPSPLIVPLPYSDESSIDPEEAFIASISSCHMLTFLAIAAKRKFVVESYIDDAVGELSVMESGRQWVSRVTLRPHIVFSGDKVPDEKAHQKLHHLAHQHCFIANSVKTEVITEFPLSR
ncbi:peroxiredoxin [Veronia nyctiphanis]|uniref:Peroxiredoxin n=1 Tax=Veronia nyctiphanis TaxID=1278244 RepID=A0A4Q0YQ53_9GAMM|nr:OsmC family protein [Veronia nyctiphanis]RXJ72723.1 peroxiredoxin [Veronia nyctiphanis]